MIRALRLSLILCLMLTGFAAASARGQSMIGERVVLCSGHVVVLIYGPDGTPSESPYFCPDMSLLLLAATAATEAKAPPRLTSFAPAVFAAPGRAVLALSRVAAQARDPPSAGLA